MTSHDVIAASIFCIHTLFHIIVSRFRADRITQEDTVRTILVIDIGSSSIRCSPFTVANGKTQNLRLISSCMQKLKCNLHKINESKRGKSISENHPSIRILKIIDEAIDKCVVSLRNHKKNTKIYGIGISSFAMNIFGVDCEGNPITPLFTYANTSHGNLATQYKGQIVENKHEQQEHLAITGTILNHQSYAVAQLRSFINQNPQQAAQVKHWTSLSSFFISKWTLPRSSDALKEFLSHSNLCPVSYSEASWMGLLNFSSKKWDQKSVETASIDPVTLPSLCDFDDLPSRDLTPDRLLLYPELRNVRFFAGIGDGAAATVGSECEGSQKVCVTIGTSAAVRVILKCDQPVVPASGLFCYRLDKDRLLLGGALTDGGSLLDWLEGLVGAHSYKAALLEVDRIYAESSYPETAPTVLPFWSGERSTGWHEGACGTISGLNHGSTAGTILMGIMEGLAYRITAIIHLMRDSGLIAAAPGACLVASGTALVSNKTLRQMLANMSGYDVVNLQSEGRGEATSFGIAKLIAETIAEEERDLSVPAEEGAEQQILRPEALDGDMWGFAQAEVLSVTRPHTALVDIEYSQRRARENSELYSKMFNTQ